MMKTRLLENYATTILGVLLISVATVAWAFDWRSTEECAIIAGWGFTFLRSKDSLIGLPAKGGEENKG